MWQIERDEAVANSEKSEGTGKTEADEDDESRRAAIEQDRQEQRDRISRWKVCLKSLLIYPVLPLFLEPTGPWEDETHIRVFCRQFLD